MKIKHKFLLVFALFVVLLVPACSDRDFNYELFEPDETQYSNAEKFANGVTRISGDSLAFKLFAPGVNEVYLIGEFTQWKKLNEYKMKKDSKTNTFFVKIGNLEPDKEYVCQYEVDGNARMGDPYTTKTSDPLDKYIPASVYPNMIPYPSQANGDIAMVVSTKQSEFNWTVPNFKLKDSDNMVIYEILLRDFTGSINEVGTLNGAKEKLSYLKNLGVNVIELMPFNEFEGNDSWGYNPSYYFAPDKAYGTADDYKSFIDECHKQGFAVIMDMVLNHAYSKCPLVQLYLQKDGKVVADNPYFNVTSPNQDWNWGYDFNHESPYVQQFVDSVCSYWMSEYKIDGFRFDFTKGFTQTPGPGWDYDQSRINILKRMSSEIKKRKSDALIIFEHLTDNKEEKELSDAGIYLWGNMNYNYNESTMGWGNEQGEYGPKGDVSWTSYKQRGWSKPTLIPYMESHDEERLMYKNEQYGYDELGYDVRYIPTGLQRCAAAATIYFTIPGPKMIWQFGELGYDISINDYGGRVDRKPSGWYLIEDANEFPENRLELMNTYKKMIDLKLSHPAFKSTDFEMDVANNQKQVLLKSSDGYVCTVANMGVSSANMLVNFGKTGTWTEVFTNKSFTVADAKQNLTLKPGEYRVYISK